MFGKYCLKEQSLLERLDGFIPLLLKEPCHLIVRLGSKLNTKIAFNHHPPGTFRPVPGSRRPRFGM